MPITHSGWFCKEGLETPGGGGLGDFVSSETENQERKKNHLQKIRRLSWGTKSVWNAFSSICIEIEIIPIRTITREVVD